MKKELDELLCKRYPKIFRDRHADMRTTCMCWGFDHGDGWFNLIDRLCHSIQNHIDQHNSEIKRTIKHNKMVEATRAGDLTLFNEQYKDVNGEWKQKYLDEILAKQSADEGTGWSRGIRQVNKPIEQVVAVQVKEKFGGLRFYINGGDDEIWGMVSLAESLSYTICEECGAPGQTVGRGWIKTLCPLHYREGDEGTAREVKWNAGVDEDEESESQE